MYLSQYLLLIHWTKCCTFIGTMKMNIKCTIFTCYCRFNTFSKGKQTGMVCTTEVGFRAETFCIFLVCYCSMFRYCTAIMSLWFKPCNLLYLMEHTSSLLEDHMSLSSSSISPANSDMMQVARLIHYRPPYPAGSVLPDRDDSVLLVRAERLSCSLGLRSTRDIFSGLLLTTSNSSAPNLLALRNCYH